MVYFLKIPGCKTQCIADSCNNAKSLYELSGLPVDVCFILCNGRLVQDHTSLEQDHVYYILPRVLGGKGGFGSMLRAIGAQIEKTTNREACRDLSGRRMRDVNNEKQLREWVAKAAEREQERQERKKERTQRRRAVPRHHFNDPDYERQKTHVTDELEDALQQGLQNVASGAGAISSGSRKRCADSTNSSRIKKACEWLGIDPTDLSDLSSDSDGDTSRPSSSCLPQEGSSVASGSGLDANVIPTVRTSSNHTVEASAGGSTTHVHVDAIQESTSTTHVEAAFAEAKSSSVGRESTPVITNKLGKDELDKMESVEELVALGLDSLKAALQTRALKCGGTLQQRAERLFSVRGLDQHQIDPAVFAKPSKSKKKK